MRFRSTTITISLYLCFFLSGVAGLVYQVVWSRYLGLILGGTGQAQVIILATFMGGLALGSALFGARSDRTLRPLALYAALEVGIGLLGLAYPALFEPVRTVFLKIVAGMGLSATGVNVASLAAAAMSVLLPTTLMGGTLPALGKYLIRKREMIGRGIASLYYLNSFGAALGAPLAGFWLISKFGLPGTIQSAAAMNLVAGLLSGLVWLIEPARERAQEQEKEQEQERATGESARRLGRVALAVIAVSGFISMVYEVAWIRLLTLALGSSTDSFPVMLSAFIFGITLGSFLLSRKRTDEGYARILGWCEILIGLSALACVSVYQLVPLWVNFWRVGLVTTEANFPFYQFIRFGLSFAIMALPTIFMGATVPAASRVVAHGLGSVGRRVGGVFAVNTLGALLGSIFAGFVLMPAVGLKAMIEIGVGASLILGLITLRAAERGEPRPETGWLRARRPFRAALAGSVAGFALYFALVPAWDQWLFTTGAFRSKQRIPDTQVLKEIYANRKVLYYRDGADATVAIISDVGPGRGEVRAMIINNKADASDGEDMIDQLLIGHVPMLIHPNPSDVLIVGLGSGVTAGATTLYPTRNVDCVELVPETLDAARLFKHVNHNAVDSGRVRYFIQDAKTYLQITPRRYDLVINEPTNLWVPGVAGLFTREYLESVRARLNPGGMILLWVHTYSMTDEALLAILGEFNQVFPYSTLFETNARNVIIVGSPEPFEPDLDRMKRHLGDPAIAADLAPYGLDQLPALLSLQLIDKSRTPAPYCDPRRPIIDARPWIEQAASRAFFTHQRVGALSAMDGRSRPPGRTGLWLDRIDLNQWLMPDPSMAAFDREIRTAGSFFPGARQAWMSLWERQRPNSPIRLMTQATMPMPGELETLRELEGSLAPPTPEEWTRRAEAMMGIYRASRSWAELPASDALRQAIQRAMAGEPRFKPRGLIWLAELEGDRGATAEAARHCEEAIAILKNDAAAHDRMIHLKDALLTLAEIHLSERATAAAREALARVEPVTGADALKIEALRARANQIDAEIPQSEPKPPQAAAETTTGTLIGIN